MTKLIIFTAIVLVIVLWLVWETKHAIIQDDADANHDEKTERP